MCSGGEGALLTLSPSPTGRGDEDLLVSNSVGALFVRLAEDPLTLLKVRVDPFPIIPPARCTSDREAFSPTLEEGASDIGEMRLEACLSEATTVSTLNFPPSSPLTDPPLPPLLLLPRTGRFPISGRRAVSLPLLLRLCTRFPGFPTSTKGGGAFPRAPNIRLPRLFGFLGRSESSSLPPLPWKNPAR